MKLWLLTIGLLVCVTGCLHAQDPAVFNHYVQSPVILNPAAVGFADEYRVMLNTRAAWAGFEEAPRTLALRANGPIGESFGLGFTFLSESAARRSRNKGQIDVSFRVNFGEEVDGKAPFQGGIGFFTELQRFTLDAGLLSNPQYQAGDPLAQEYFDGDTHFDAGIGIYGAYLENTFGGITINNLVENRLNNIAGENLNEAINFTFLFGHAFDLETSGITLTPSLMLRDVQGAPFMLDVNVQAEFLDDQFLAGLSYRNLGSVGMLLGARLNGFQLYYAYDLGFGGLQQYSSGSHELTVGYAITRRAMNEARTRRARQSGQRLN